MIPALSHAGSAVSRDEQLKEKLMWLKAQKKPLNLDLFSFKKSQELLKDVKGNFSDLVREERDIR